MYEPECLSNLLFFVSSSLVLVTNDIEHEAVQHALKSPKLFTPSSVFFVTSDSNVHCLYVSVNQIMFSSLSSSSSLARNLFEFTAIAGVSRKKKRKFEKSNENICDAMIADLQAQIFSRHHSFDVRLT